MNPWETDKLVVCSVMIKPIRAILLTKLRTWIDKIVHVPVHTFVVEESKLPLDPNNIDGYWYCSGDFCNIDEAGVYQDIGHANIDFAKCLVAPNIKDDDVLRPAKVIAGTYGVNYVCHNITNRVLYSTYNKLTLSDVDILKTGYPVVVKSVLGVYGQNKVEWERRKKSCSIRQDKKSNEKETKADQESFFIAQREEINKIHLIACGNDYEKSLEVTRILEKTDGKFYLVTRKLVNEFEKKLINQEAFNIEMVYACSCLFSETIDLVGIEMAERIYPGCILHMKNQQEEHEDEVIEEVCC
ncbi:hypothetical protein [Aeromonas dhakensis]|uniref:hypothetical protein n=1 Tax=Aeromonas dhakensis TaxID=196024 RepID=UPI0039B78F25